ncbi:MAG: AEC family transporter [Promethearchaeota archaeon]
MTDVNSQFLISLSVMILGYVLKRFKVLSESDGKTLSRVIFYITLPGTMLNTLPRIELDLSMLFMPFFPVIYCTGMLGIAWVAFGRSKRPERGLLMFTSLGFNVGNFAYPLIQGIYGYSGLGYAAMFDFGNVFVIFSMAYVIAIKFSPRNDVEVQKRAILKKIFTAPPLLASIIALLLNLAGITYTGIIDGLLNTIAQANHLIVYLTLGLFLNLGLKKEHWKLLAHSLGIRYGIGLIVGITSYMLIPLEILPRTILLIGFILPIGMTNLVYMIQYEHDEKLGGMLINFSNVMSFGVMWLLLAIFS